MLDCLIDRIGVKDCSVTAPESGLYINDLGITLDSINKLVESEQITWKNLWNDIQNRASKRFSNLVFNELRKCYKLRTKECSDDLVCANVEAFDVAFQYLLGEELMNTRLFSSRWNKWTMDKNTASELKGYFSEQLYIELEIACKTVVVDPSSDCMEHNGGQKVQFVTILP